jgi:hypothetical protein
MIYLIKKLFFISCAIAVLWCYPAYASERTSPRSLDIIMTDIGDTMLQIYPLTVAKRPFTQQDIAKLNRAITHMSGLFHEAEPFIDRKSPGYQISYEFVSQYLSVVKDILQHGEVDYARNHLYALGEICASCHTQDTTLRTLFSGTTRDQLPNDYAFAELNYMTRNYHDAILYYKKFLDSPGRKTELEIIQPLQRIVTIYTQVENDPADGIKLLKKYLKLPQQTEETRAELQGWIKGLKALQNDAVSKTTAVSFANLQAYVKKYLGNSEDFPLQTQSTAEEEVQRVWLRGRLYHYLNKAPKRNEIPMLLYWLAVIDRSIAYNYYFSLADLYLKQCVLKYPRHPYARRCFEEYKYYTDHTYRREGREIPSGIKQEIIQMQNALRDKKL